MFDLLPVFIPILLVDIINPVLLAAVIYALGSKKPILYSMLILTGWLVVYFGSGVLLALGLESMMEFLKNPRPVDFYIESIVAVLLIWFGIRFLFPSKQPAKKSFDDEKSLSAFGAFGIGATINLIGLPFAIPYFAALDQILKANLNWAESLTALFLYNVLYILPFFLIIVVRVILREKSDKLTETINKWMDKIGKILLPGLMILLGLFLIADAVMYFTTGIPLF